METLIALGVVSALSLYALFLIKYIISIVSGDFDENTDNGDDMTLEFIMDFNSALTSASIIVTVVNIGKHFEQKVKDKIEQMSEQIFPESTLFSNMSV